jgi:hypothetical protein
MAVFILTLDSLALQRTSQSSWERSETQFREASFLSGRGSAFLEHPCRQPSPAAFDIRHHHLHFGHRASGIGFEPSLRETLVDSNHRGRASIRTLNGPFWVRCNLGFDRKPRFITTVTNLGFVGCCYLLCGLNRPSPLTQSPQQGGGCRRLPNFPDSSRFLRHQLISAPLLLPSTATSRPRPLSDWRACFLLWLTLSLGSYRRRYRRGRALAQRLIYFSTHPETVQ